MKMSTLIISLVFACQGLAQSRIIGGQPISGGEAPWQLSLKSRFGSHFCAATLIAEDVALTAAHCVWTDGPGDFSIQGGSAAGKLGQLSSLPSVSDIVIHPEFDREHFTAHDIAILFLRRKIQVSDRLQPIAIVDGEFPLSVKDQFHQMTQWEYSTSGWGMTTPPNLLQNPSEQLMEVVQKPLASSQVSILYPEVREYLDTQFDIGERTIARIQSHGAQTLLADGAVTPGGTCSGDSGGPLVIMWEDEPRLIGLSSYTAGGDKQCLGVSIYSDIQAYSPWIQAEIEQRRHPL
jgi:secreted trypsin-like serine protease